jgi:hypothetical protein
LAERTKVAVHEVSFLQNLIIREKLFLGVEKIAPLIAYGSVSPFLSVSAMKARASPLSSGRKGLADEHEGL